MHRDTEQLLRRYLEQRREMGERELVLDGLSVEEVMRLVGAPGGVRHAQSPGAAPPREGRAAPTRPATAMEPSPVRPAPPHPASPRAADDAVLAPGVVVPDTERDLFAGPLARADTAGAIAELVRTCERCPLFATATHAVPGEGSVTAQLMCIGEAPGASEDASGRPFVGQAGQLLTKILAAVNLSRDDVFITNVLKHRPPGNRNPRPEEVQACQPYLMRQIELIRPKVILALGTFAAQTLLQSKLSIGKLRCAVHRAYGASVVVTYHPAALLRNPAWKRPAWEDVQLARRLLDSSP